jgi:hypothetical protein
VSRRVPLRIGARYEYDGRTYTLANITYGNGQVLLRREGERTISAAVSIVRFHERAKLLGAES